MFSRLLRSLLLLAVLGAPCAAQSVFDYPPTEDLGPEAVGVSPVPDPVLTAGLLNCWKLGEASGTRVDSCGSNNLSEGTANPTSVVSGVDGNAIQTTFIPASCLTGSVVNLSPLTEWTINVWTGLLSSNVYSVANGSLVIRYNFDEAANDYYQIIDLSEAQDNDCSVLAPTGSAFHMFTAWRDPGDEKIHCALDAATESVGSKKYKNPATLTGTLYVGSQSCLDTFGAPTDELVIWSRVLSQESREKLLTRFPPTF